jgi:hypothetical protein
MDVKSTLKVYHQAEHPGKRGVTDCQTYQRLVGWPEVQERPTARASGVPPASPAPMSSSNGT